MIEYTIENMYDLKQSIAGELLGEYKYPWEALPKISEFIINLGNNLSEDEYDHPADNVWISKSAKVAPTAYVNGPCIICPDAEIRHCAYIREITDEKLQAVQ